MFPSIFDWMPKMKSDLLEFWETLLGLGLGWLWAQLLRLGLIQYIFISLFKFGLIHFSKPQANLMLGQIATWNYLTRPLTLSDRQVASFDLSTFVF